MKKQIRKLVRNEINKLFELQGFQAKGTEQLATNMSMFKLPRKGIDDVINNFNKIESEKEYTDEEKEEMGRDIFNSPAQNAYTAPTLTNLYESEVEENYSMFGDTAAQQQNLDWERYKTPLKGGFGKDTEEEVARYNDNINRDLNQVPVGDNSNNKPAMNKSKNF